MCRLTARRCADGWGGSYGVEGRGFLFLPLFTVGGARLYLVYILNHLSVWCYFIV